MFNINIHHFRSEGHFASGIYGLEEPPQRATLMNDTFTPRLAHAADVRSNIRKYFMENLNNRAFICNRLANFIANILACIIV